MVRDSAARILREAGYQTIEASDGQEAVRLFAENKDIISAVVFDLVMPKMTGRQIYERLTSIRADIGVVVVTGYGPETPQADFLANSGVRLIEKPFDEDTFLHAVHAVLH